MKVDDCRLKKADSVMKNCLSNCLAMNYADDCRLKKAGLVMKNCPAMNYCTDGFDCIDHPLATTAYDWLFAVHSLVDYCRQQVADLIVTKTVVDNYWVRSVTNLILRCELVAGYPCYDSKGNGLDYLVDKAVDLF